jgi:hypothetical protein
MCSENQQEVTVAEMAETRPSQLLCPVSVVVKDSFRHLGVLRFGGKTGR